MFVGRIGMLYDFMQRGAVEQQLLFVIFLSDEIGIYFPIQNLLNIKSSWSSLVICPVISPR